MHKDRMMKVLEDLWKYVNKRNENECWVWTRGTNNSGYGSVCFEGEKYQTHRIAFVITKGGITLNAPKDRKGSGFLMHSCDNRKCCNQAHLSVGTYSDNYKDAKAKGRSSAPRGEAHPKAALTNEQAAEARRLLSLGKTRRQVREHFHVSERVMDRIARNESYL